MKTSYNEIDNLKNWRIPERVCEEIPLQRTSERSLVGSFALTMSLFTAEATIVTTAVSSPEKIGDPFAAGVAAGAIGVATLASIKRYIEKLRDFRP